MDKDKIISESEKIDSILESIEKRQNSVVDKESVVYLINNIEKFKYILASYPMFIRNEVMINHLKKQFVINDYEAIKRVLRKHAIYSELYLYSVISILVLLFIFVYGYVIVNEFSGIGLLLIILGPIFGLFLGAGLEWIFNQRVRTYFIPKKYSHLKIPKNQIEF